ncbi:hypothetical protein [Conexibacter arvalis]|uniref:Fibronectin type-III domain-containing protein n=1 Tax=Conexibacter arvalis TaxID=912552 RepID=A0A840IJX5_9ACTN|nr:hypothetical protein [Conexibacter arvalis]MBB4664541.1 hypothetical protein [Conexibacter arvalis]
MVRSLPLLAALVGAAALAPAAAPAAKTYKSPGYRGTKRIPRTAPLPPPRAVVLAQAGERPQLLVDAAGTAHVVWNERTPGQPDTLRYCRLRRGGSGCEASQALVPAQPYDEGNAPAFNNDVGVPRVLALNGQLALLTNRYPNVVPTPDGQTSASNTYLFASEDGGSSFGPPALVGSGQTSGEPAVWGPPEAPRIGLISDTQTGGAFFQSIAPGRYSGTTGNLGPDGIDSAAAPFEGGTVAVAFATISSVVHVRIWSGQGDPQDPGTWTDQSFPGEEPRLASGPAGTFLLTRTADAAREQVVRRVTRGGLGAPAKIPQTANSAIGDLVQDGSGRLTATYRQQVGSDERLLLRTSSDGVRWSAALTLRRVPIATGVWASDAGAAADGGGFVVTHEAPGGAPGAIVAVPFGSQRPTGAPGLGNLAGGAGDPSVVETCQRISFGSVRVLADGGCLLSASGRAGVKVSEGPLRLNGLEVIPEGSTRILLNARARTIDTTGAVRVQLRAPGIDPIVLFRGELHLSLRDESAAAAGGGGPIGGCRGQRLASFNAGGALLKGFSIAGSIDVFMTPDAVCIPVSLGLPKAFGGIRGDAVLRADNRRGLHVDTLRIAVEQAFIGPVLLEDLLVSYTAGGDQWAGRAQLGLPPQPGGAKLAAGVRFAGGAFREGSLRLTFPRPGLPLDPFAASYLSHVSGGFAIDPLTLSVGAGIGVVPAGPLYAVEVDGRLTAAFRDPITFTFDGTGKLFSFPVANTRLVVRTDGFASARGAVSVGLPGVSVEGSLNAFVDLRSRSFGGDVKGAVCIAGICPARGEAVLSSRGIGACVTQIVDYGFGYRWGAAITDVDLMFGSCDLGPYRVSAPAGAARAGDDGGARVTAPAGAARAGAGGGARAAGDAPGPGARAAADGAVTVARGTALLSVRVAGEGGAPAVVLVSPSGERIVPSAEAVAGQPAYARQVAELAATFVAVRRPAAGTWRIEADPAGPAIREVARAAALPAPRVSARVGGRGRARTLRYRATRGGGLATTFVERWSGGQRTIGTARRAAGTIRFAPAPGPRGRRDVVALVTRDGLPRLERTVARYTAPPPRRLARVRGLRIARGAKAATVRWRGVAGARTYAVRIEVADGRRQLRLLGARARSVRVAGVGRRERVTVVVTARDAAGRSGAAARVRR